MNRPMVCAVLTCAIALVPGAGRAQQSGTASAPANSTSPAAETVDLPAIEVVTSAQKAARAKKKAPAVSPLSNAPSSAASSAAAAASTSAAPTQSSAIPAPVFPAAAESAAIADTIAEPVTIPSAVSTVSSTDIEREGTAQVQQALQQQVPGIIISDAAGNPIRAEVSYRGFDASPVSGRSQGVAVYQNGVRINEAFGDTVQWDVLPSNAIEAISIVSNNPSFGLNALGGAISIQMKDGFSYQGAEIDVMAGSFGRRQIGLQAGGSSGNAGIYVAAEGINDDSFRDFSDSQIRRFYGDIGFRGSVAELHFSLTAAHNEIGASAAAPVELLERDWSNTFTTPQTTDMEVIMPTISGTVKATDTLTFSGVSYYRSYKNKVVDGNVTELEECDDGGIERLCPEDNDGNFVRNFATGALLDADDFDEPLGTIDRMNTDSESWGGVLEAQEKTPLFGRPNLFIAGVSYDHGRSNYATSSELGQIQPKYVVRGSGVILADDDNEVSPRDLDSENTYWGLYFSNALDVTDRLTVTIGGRYNHATIKMDDNTGNFPELNKTNKYERFNPMAGANFKLLPGISLYGGYSESNRAPTPAELGCAEPEAPCLIEGFLTDDPPLEQVVGRTAEIGLRGEGYTYDGRFTWSAGLFRTMASDDILPITDSAGRVYFINAGDTLRQGVELAGTYETSRWNVYASYALVDATLDSCDHPSGECAFLEAGDNLPGIPRHRFKAGFEYWLTPQWKFGADLVAASSQPFYQNEVSDEEGLDDRLAGYTRVDLHTSYDVTENIQIYGLVKNLFNKKYGLYGTYFEAEEVGEDVDEELGGPGFTDSRTISPSMPIAAYGGVKIKF